MQITPLAYEKIKNIAINDGKQGMPFRIGIQGGGCSGLSYIFSFSISEDRDHKFTDGETTVVVDPKSFIYLNGCIIDWQSSLMKTGFVIENPNEKNKCSCGKSFGV